MTTKEDDSVGEHQRAVRIILKNLEHEHYQYYYKLVYNGDGGAKTVSRPKYSNAYVTANRIPRTRVGGGKTFDQINLELFKEAREMYAGIVKKAGNDARITKERELTQLQFEVNARMIRIRRVFKYLWLATPKLPRDIVKIIFNIYRIEVDPYVDIPSYLYVDFSQWESIY